MKIVIHTMYFLPEFGSAPILMNELAGSLAAKGHTVEVIATTPRPPHHEKYKGRFYIKEQKDGFTVKRIRTNHSGSALGRLAAWSIYTGFTFLNLFTVRKGDVLFLRLPPLQLGITGFLARIFRRAKVVLNVQDIHPDLSIESGILTNPLAIKAALGFEKWIYDRSPNILVISDGFKKNLTDKKVPSEKIAVIPNWVDTGVLSPKPKDNPVSRKFGIHDKFIAMYSGTISLSSFATLENILTAAKALSHIQDIRFVIVGDGMKKADLAAKAESLKLNNVIFLPFQPYEDLPDLLAAGDILMVPLDKEKSMLSVPSKLYNFMAAGRPIMGLAHQNSEVRYLIDQAGCGVCVPPGDITAIAGMVGELKKNNELRQKMAENSRREAVEKYSRTKVLDDMDVYIRSL